MLSEIFCERIEPDVLGRYLSCMADIELASALGLSDVNPVGSSIACPGKSSTFDEALHEDRAVTIARLPIFRQAAYRHSEELRSKVGAGDPG